MGTGSQALAKELPRPPAQSDAKAKTKWDPAELVRFGAVAFELGLLVLVVRMFQIEGKAFLYLLALTFGGFVVHHFLPSKLRMPFFSLLSVGAIALVLGPSLASWIVILGLALIGLAHIPIDFRARLAIVVAAAGLLALFRGDVIPAPWSSVVWPVLGSMFMFRYLVYLYDLRNKSAPFSFWRSTSYFFLLPNVCFTLFPVIDYQTFCRTYYNTDEIKIYQSGVQWMLRGIGQMLIYRVIYQNVTVDPAQIKDLGDVWTYILGNFGLYFKVLGSFSLIVGILHLFGFNLPLPNNNFLLGKSFTDFWRRANIYWKDFILKLCFQPAYMKLNKTMPEPRAMLIATLWAFALTWLLHSYQWFWIRSKFPIAWQDMVMWGYLGIGVYIAMVLESKKPKKKSLKKPVRTLKGDVVLGAKIIGMYFGMATMWALVWTSPGWDVTKALLVAASHVSIGDLAYLFGTLIVFGIGTVLWTYTPSEQIDLALAMKTKLDPKVFWRDAAVTGALAGGILLVGAYPVVLAHPKLADAADRVRANKLSERDASLLKQGYYEDLSDATRFSPELAELYAARPKNWDVNPLVVQYETYPDYGLQPSASAMFKGAKFSTNSFGMRDQEYTKEKAPGTYRMSFYGQSVEQGSGVGDGEAYEAIFEARLNKEQVSTSSAGVKRFEVLNFANGGYGPIHKLAHFEKTLDFKPDALLYVSITDIPWTMNELLSAQEHRLGPKLIPYEEIHAIRKKAGVEDNTPRVIAEQKLRPHLEEVVRWVYKRMVEICRERNIRPFVIILAQPEDDPELLPMMEKELQMASEAGFEVLDLRDVYAGVPDPKKFWIAKWDHHPNVEAHRMMADKLYARFVEKMKK
jgi:hypothetical protein